MLVQIECEMKIQFHELSSRVYTHFKTQDEEENLSEFISDCVLME
jgi:hypothetical protein